ncbi:hypothetical protein NUU61_005325 [Penicillium alfredii]|uniref:Uncharacterized protein n=1 Tax=Penicillium alfredii TaxID=1506179 RepID=A0A9W9K7H7_9EURO|nr:uncharacterized protein NUU61_005325 [Penicillium alfredii]KAJ5095969.1 hypothetical protein NUU61_005325 [Penicillium alfredii]
MALAVRLVDIGAQSAPAIDMPHVQHYDGWSNRAPLMPPGDHLRSSQPGITGSRQPALPDAGRCVGWRSGVSPEV